MNRMICIHSDVVSMPISIGDMAHVDFLGNPDDYDVCFIDNPQLSSLGSDRWVGKAIGDYFVMPVALGNVVFKMTDEVIDVDKEKFIFKMRGIL